MRTIVDLTDEQVAALKEIASEDGISRTEAVRRAIDLMVKERAARTKAAIRAEGFGAWGPPDFDAREFVEAIRSEWDERASRLGY